MQFRAFLIRNKNTDEIWGEAILHKDMVYIHEKTTDDTLLSSEFDNAFGGKYLHGNTFMETDNFITSIVTYEVDLNDIANPKIKVIDNLKFKRLYIKGIFTSS